jgi:hypothetical protein
MKAHMLNSQPHKGSYPAALSPVMVQPVTGLGPVRYDPLVVSEIEEIFLNACRRRNEPPDSQIASELKPIMSTLYASGLDERKALIKFADVYFSFRLGS